MQTVARVRTRPARGDATDLRRERDADVLAGHLFDAARYDGGHTPEACFPGSEAAVAALLAEGRPLLPIGAQSSLTGGATPRGEVLVSTARLRGLGDWTSGSVRAGAGVVLADLDAAAAARDAWFPPVPTYNGATVGGVVATDAAGAATFKHGTVRAWVKGLSVVLACGEVLDVARGDACAGADGVFEIETASAGVLRVPVPRVATPDVPKCSAGYRGGRGLDLVDLFVGAEGTLGIVTEVTLALASPRPAMLVLLVPVPGDEAAVELAGALRAEAARRRGGDASAADVAAIEYMDRRCVEILREDGVARREGVALPDGPTALVLVQVELPPGYDRARAVDELSHGHDGTVAGPVASLLRLLGERGLVDAAIPALPGEDDRRRALFALREAVPQGVNARVRDRALASGEPVSKSGGDVIVPFARLGEAMARYRAITEASGLDTAVWGHISDGNLHPNLLAADAAGMARARAAQFEIGRAAIELGGCPLAEHGTGRNPAKQALLAMFHGEAGVASMRATRRALDPRGLLAPGVLFPID